MTQLAAIARREACKIVLEQNTSIGGTCLVQKRVERLRPDVSCRFSFDVHDFHLVGLNQIIKLVRCFHEDGGVLGRSLLDN